MTAFQKVTDQMHRTIRCPLTPKRIISLVPSQTELLADLDLADQVVGITKFCVHPDTWFRTKTRIGGTKTLNLEQIHALKPDLIIGNKEENEKEQIEALMPHFPVWMSDISHLDDAVGMINALGQVTNRVEPAKKISLQITNQFAALTTSNITYHIAYFIWRNPYMVAASGTFIDNLLEKAGFKNIFATKSRYPSVTLQELADAQPEVIFLSSEPYPFKAIHLEEFQAACPNAIIQLVDGELFSWYGSRLLYSATYLQQLKQAISKK